MTPFMKRCCPMVVNIQRIPLLVVGFLLLMISFMPADAGSQEPVASGIIQVELREWEILVDETILKPGKVTFYAENQGSFMHEMVVIRTTLSADAFEVAGSRVQEEVIGTVRGEIEGLPAGKLGEITLDLPEGHYVLFCNNREKGHAEGHYQKGMRVSFKVGSP